MSRIRWIVALMLLTLLYPPPASAASAPDTVARINLPVGWQPEGVTTDGTYVYSGSLATGAILRANPRTGRTRILPRSATGKPAVGIEYDARRDVIWVAGGPTGEIRVQRADTGRLLRRYKFPAGSRFINDLVVTPEGVYATDSNHAVLGVVRLGPGKKLPPSGRVALLRLRGDFVLKPGFNANGIVTFDGWLLVVQSNTGKLFRVNPFDGQAAEVEVDGPALRNGDGLEMDGNFLYVVRNQDNLVAVIELYCGVTAGIQVDEITGAVDVPTTVALVGNHLWAANARFGGTPKEQAAKKYWLKRLPAFDRG